MGNSWHPFTSGYTLLFLFLSLLFNTSSSFRDGSYRDYNVVEFEKEGGIPNKHDYDTQLHNGQVLNNTLNSLEAGDLFYIKNKTYHLIGGIIASDIHDVIIKIDGTLLFSDERETWPTDENGEVLEAIMLYKIKNVVFTSSGMGTLDGNGEKWWGAIDYAKHQEDRPRLFHVRSSENVIIENILFKDSPFWTCFMEDSNGLIIRHTQVSARWTKQDGHNMIDLQAFNTDGFDVTGKNVHIHDCDIYCQDDCISVKDGSEDMMFERISCSGLGLVIGSIGHSIVNNITFKDSVMPNTFKGIYMKTRWSDDAPAQDGSARISNILYQNITMEAPEQYAIWIGPAQQAGQPCSLLWTVTPDAKCIMSGFQTWTNITLRDIYVHNSLKSPGVIMGNVSNPIHNLVFDNVVFSGNIGEEPWGDDYYYCDGIEGKAIGSDPVPQCFQTAT